MLTAFDPAIGRGLLTTTAVIMWATALSSQHFRHVIRGPVTPDDVAREAMRLQPTTNPPAVDAGTQLST